jgi:hypothetical protein
MSRTVKLNSNDFFDIELATSEVSILLGARGCGKTWAVREKVMSNFFSTGAQFILIFTTKEGERKSDSWIKRWLMANGKGDWRVKRGKPTAGCLTLIDPDEERYHIGYVGNALNMGELQGGEYPLVETIIFEEFKAVGLTKARQSHMAFNLAQLMETVFRDRVKKVYILGNSLDLFDPFEGILEPYELIKIFKKSSRKGYGKNYLDFLSGEPIVLDQENMDDHINLMIDRNYVISINVFNRKYYIRYVKNPKTIKVEGGRLMTKIRFFSSKEIYFDSLKTEKGYLENPTLFMSEKERLFNIAKNNLN